jgi:uncharacterized protein YjcR
VRELVAKGMTVPDIAKELGLPPSTVRRYSGTGVWGRLDNMDELEETRADRNKKAGVNLRDNVPKGTMSRR